MDKSNTVRCIEDPAVIEMLLKHLTFDKKFAIYRPRRFISQRHCVMSLFFLSTGSTCVIMEKFERDHLLRLVEKFRITHTQVVPTMIVCLLKLAPNMRQRYDISSFIRARHLLRHHDVTDRCGEPYPGVQRCEQ